MRQGLRLQNRPAYRFLRCRSCGDSFLGIFDKFSLQGSAKIMHKFFTNKIVVYLNLAVIVFGSLLFFYWYLLDGTLVDRILTTDHVTYKLTQDTYRPGDLAYGVPNEFCKLRSIPADMYIAFVDGTKTDYPMEIVEFPVGCVNGEPRKLREIPNIQQANPMVDTGRFVGKFCYHNPIKQICIPFESNLVKVIPYEGYVK